jgi:hypothetical protein
MRFVWQTTLLPVPGSRLHMRRVIQQPVRRGVISGDESTPAVSPARNVIEKGTTGCGECYSA